MIMFEHLIPLVTCMAKCPAKNGIGCGKIFTPGKGGSVLEDTTTQFMFLCITLDAVVLLNMAHE